LWRSENIAQKAVILVGNKADLARSRVISSEGECHRQDFHFLSLTHAVGLSSVRINALTRQ
jgi:Rad/Gem-related GTP binding protein 1